MKKVAFKTLGCKVNLYETEAMKNSFIANDYEIVDFNSVADVYVINTCTVTNTADSKSRKEIRRAIKTNKDAIVCAVGCYTQVSAKEASKIEGLDIIIGNKNKNKIVEIIENNKRFVHTDNIFDDNDFEELDVEDFKNNTRAFLKIQDGCNQFCSYCKIPYARGKMRSRNSADILRSIRTLVDNGFKEIVLTGIHTAGYGQDIEGYDFEQLLRDILNNVTGEYRIRISSIEATYITDGIIELIKTDNRLVKHLHIPIQAASNDVLKSMKRQYSVEEFMEIINKIRINIPNISLTTDLIVGFPTETDKLFEIGMENLNKIRFNEIHVFPFSKRSGTAAALLKEINGKIISSRVEKVIDLSNQVAKEYAQTFEGKTVEVLIETDEVGFTSEYIKVKVNGAKKNQFLKVLITTGDFPESIGKIA